MADVLLFLGVVRKHWWPLMSCAFFTFLAIYAEATNQRNSWIVRASISLAIALLFVATYLAWLDEHRARRKAETNIHEIAEALSDFEAEGTTLYRRPAPVGDPATVARGTEVLNWIDRVGQFLLKECGKSDARDFDRMPSGTFDTTDVFRGLQELLSRRLDNLSSVRRRWHDRVVQQSLPVPRRDR